MMKLLLGLGMFRPAHLHHIYRDRLHRSVEDSSHRKARRQAGGSVIFAPRLRCSSRCMVLSRISKLTSSPSFEQDYPEYEILFCASH